MAINPATGQLFKAFEALSDLQIDGLECVPAARR